MEILDELDGTALWEEVIDGKTILCEAEADADADTVTVGVVDI